MWIVAPASILLASIVSLSFLQSQSTMWRKLELRGVRWRVWRTRRRVYAT